jgi:hypothetical protein
MNGCPDGVGFGIESKKKYYEASYFADVETKYQDLRLEVHADEVTSWNRL